MRTWMLFPLVLIATLTGACSSSIYEVASEADPETQFDSFETYRWYSDRVIDPKILDYLDGEELDEGIRDEIDHIMRAKGFTLKPDGEVDFLINYSLLTEDREDLRTYNTYGGLGDNWLDDGYFGSSGGGERTSTEVVTYVRGQMLIDILRPEDQVLLWRGSADGTIPEGDSMETREARARELIADIMSRFPP